TFTTLNVGTQHTCARASDGSWYCWGLNNYGQLGTGATGPESCVGGPGVPCSSTPVRVSAGINFTAVVAGRRHSCRVTSAGAAAGRSRSGRSPGGRGSTDHVGGRSRGARGAALRLGAMRKDALLIANAWTLV